MNAKILEQSKECSKSLDILNLNSESHLPQVALPADVEGINDTLINSQEGVITDDGNNSAQVQLVKLVDSQGAPKVAEKDVTGASLKEGVNA